MATKRTLLQSFTTPFGDIPATAALVAACIVWALVLGVWAIAAYGGYVAEMFLPVPDAVIRRGITLASDGTLFVHIWSSVKVVILGFILSAVIAVPLGLYMGTYRIVQAALEPLVNFIRYLPVTSLVPLFILWIGIGMTMKVALTATIVFFLVFLNTYSGVRNVSQELVAIVKLMGANERDILSKVVLPSALTWVFAGLRISVPYALIGAVVGELMASNKGLGALLVSAQGQFDTAGVFAALIGITALAYLLNSVVKFAERKAMRWKTVDVDDEVRI